MVCGRPAGTLAAKVVPWVQGLLASLGTPAPAPTKAAAATCAGWIAGLASVAPWAPPGLGFDLPSVIGLAAVRTHPAARTVTALCHRSSHTTPVTRHVTSATAPPSDPRPPTSGHA